MKKNRRCSDEKERIMPRFLCATLSVCLLALPIPGLAPFAAAQEVKVVVHPDVSGSTLTQEEIRRIFLGKSTQWDRNNQKIHFIVLEGGDAHETFIRRFIGKTPSQFRNYWRMMVFTGKGRAPKSLGSPGEVVDYVANTAGAIGYVPPETDTKDVGVISVLSQ